MDFETLVKKNIIDKYIRYDAKFNTVNYYGREDKYLTPLFLIHKQQGIKEIIRIQPWHDTRSCNVYFKDEKEHIVRNIEKLYTQAKTSHEIKRDYPELFI